MAATVSWLGWRRPLLALSVPLGLWILACTGSGDRGTDVRRESSGLLTGVTGAGLVSGSPPPSTLAPDVPQLELMDISSMQILEDEQRVALRLRVTASASLASVVINPGWGQQFLVWPVPGEDPAGLSPSGRYTRALQLRLELSPEVQAGQCLQIAASDAVGRLSAYQKLCLVRAQSGLPVASAGADMTVFEGESVQLQGDLQLQGAALDQILWQVRAGPAGIVLQNPDTASPSLIAPQVDTTTAVTLRMTVLSETGHPAVDQLRITVLDTDRAAAPLVWAGHDFAVPAGMQSVELPGWASDADSAVALYWMVDDPSVHIRDHRQPGARFDAPQVDRPTALNFMLVGSDGLHEAKDQVTVRVYPSPGAAMPVRQEPTGRS